MSLFRRPDYDSEITQFLTQLKQQKPGLEERQRQGRELLWDKQVDRTVWRDYRAARSRRSPTSTRPTASSKAPS